MITVQIQDWNIFLRDGEQFLKTARGAYLKEKKGFSPETIYNLVCMGIEKLIMAFLMQRGDLAENHTMADLLHALERHLGVDPVIDEKLRFLDSFQEICDLDTFVVKRPGKEDLEKIVQAGNHLHGYLTPYFTNS